jgi:hypothetical protein
VNLCHRKRGLTWFSQNVRERLVNDINRIVKLGDELNTRVVRARLIYSSKRKN